MMPLDKQLVGQILQLSNGEAQVSLEILAKALSDYHRHQCTINEGNQLYRDQGAAQLADWLLQLPKVLRNGHGSSTQSMG